MENYLVNPVKRFRIRTTKRTATKLKRRIGDTMNPLMLINPRKRRKAHKGGRKLFGAAAAAHAKRLGRKGPKKARKVAHRRVRRALAVMHANPVRRHARRSFRRNPVKRGKKFFSMRPGTAATNVLMGAAFASGAMALSAFGIQKVGTMFPAMTFLQSPLGKIGTRLVMAFGLYQLGKNVKVIGEKNGAYMAIGAAIPAVADVAGMLGLQQIAVTSKAGVGLLPYGRPSSMAFVPKSAGMGSLAASEQEVW